MLTAPDGATAALVVEAKETVDPRNVSRVLDQLNLHKEQLPPPPSASGILVAPFLGPRTRQLLKSGACGFVDSTGNAWLALSSPALFLETTGAMKDPKPPPERPLLSLKGQAAGRAVRAICDFSPPFKLRDLARRARVSPPTLSRVLTLLDREALVDRDRKGTVINSDWQGTIRRWTEDYAFSTSNRVRMFLDPRGIDAFKSKLSSLTRTYAATGSLVASRIEPIAPPRLAQVFVENINAAAESLDLKEVEKGANVMLAEPFAPVVFDRVSNRKGLICAALTQVAADLLTSPGRAPEEAERLLIWMENNTDAWRQ